MLFSKCLNAVTVMEDMPDYYHTLVLMQDEICRRLDCKSLAALRLTNRAFADVTMTYSEANVQRVSRMVRALEMCALDYCEALDNLDAAQYDVYWWFRFDQPSCINDLYTAMNDFYSSHRMWHGLHDFMPTCLQYTLAAEDAELAELAERVRNHIIASNRHRDHHNMLFVEINELQWQWLYLYKRRLEKYGYSAIIDIQCNERDLTESSILATHHLLRHGKKLYGDLLDRVRTWIQTTVLDPYRACETCRERYIQKKLSVMRKSMRLLGDRTLAKRVRRYHFRNEEPIPLDDIEEYVVV